MDVNAVAYDGTDKRFLANLKESAISNVKRVRHYSPDWHKPDSEDPYLIQDFCEVKTTWHPIENISGSGSGY